MNIKRLKDLCKGITDTSFQYPGLLGRSGYSCAQLTHIARTWLRQFQLSNIDFLRSLEYTAESKNKGVTIVTYTYPQHEDDFIQVEFAILHTWRMLGRMNTTIVANKPFQRLKDFAAKWNDSITLQFQPALTSGTNRCLSYECLKSLHKRFSSPYCLTIQDDGFPMQANLSDFLGKYDFLGAPLIRARVWPLEILIEKSHSAWLNGGFSLRTMKICQAAAQCFQRWEQSASNPEGYPQEDYFFTKTARSYPDFERAIKFPPLQRAREFSAQDLFGCVNIHARKYSSFGFHGPTTAIQLIPEFRTMGYTIPHLP